LAAFAASAAAEKASANAPGADDGEAGASAETEAEETEALFAWLRRCPRMRCERGAGGMVAGGTLRKIRDRLQAL
jgi:hypothetical protein